MAAVISPAGIGISDAIVAATCDARHTRRRRRVRGAGLPGSNNPVWEMAHSRPRASIFVRGASSESSAELRRGATQHILPIGRCGLWGNPPAKVRKRTEAVSRSVTIRRASKR